MEFSTLRRRARLWRWPYRRPITRRFHRRSSACSECEPSRFFVNDFVVDLGMFSKILIANRGEIAVRVIRACREMGIESVAVYSDADAQALHTTPADHRWRIGPAAAAESYLSVGAVINPAAAP